MNVSASISVPENLRNRVAELAASEQRSFSQMWCLLVERSLDGDVEAKPRALTEPGRSHAGKEASRDVSMAGAETSKSSPGSVSVPRVVELPDEPVPSKPVSTPSAVDISALMRMPGRRINKCAHRLEANEVCPLCDKPFLRRLG